MDEEQFILRLPDPLAQRLRLGLSSKAKRDAAGAPTGTFHVRFSGPREAVFSLDGEDYPASLMDLPCIVETHKTADKRTYFKSGDVHQVLVVRMPEENAPENFNLPHGVTPAGKDAAKRFHVPKTVFTADQVESVENQMKYVVDNKIQFVRKKQDPAPQHEEDELIIEEEGDNTTQNNRKDDVAPEARGSTKDASAQGTTPKDAPKDAAGDEGKAAETVATSVRAEEESAAQKDGSAKADAEKAEPAESTKDVTEAARPEAAPEEKAAPAPTPSPLASVAASPAAMPSPTEGEAVANEEAEEDDDFAEMLAGEMMDDNDAEREAEDARRRIERTTLDSKIEEQRSKIRDQEAQAARAPNPILKKRILSKVDELKTQLAELEKSRSALD